MLVSMTLLAFIHTVTILCLYSKSRWIFGETGNEFIMNLLIFLTVVIVILNFIGSKKILNSLYYSEEKVKKGNWLLLVYLILSFGIMIGSIVLESYKSRLEAEMPTKITPIHSDSLK